MKVVIIGTGNTAHVLGRKIAQAGNDIVQVVGRDLGEAHQLGSLFNSNVVYNTRYINPSADIYLISVSDTYLTSVSQQLKLKSKIVVHTAAAVTKEVLAQCSENYGVVYPLQTLHKENKDLPAIPVLIDANNEETKAILSAFASDWAHSVTFATDEERLKLHIAGVFVNNFTNHLFAIAANYCKAEKLKFSLLQPLIEETARAINGKNPASVQTGPAVRKDLLTIEKHLQMLAGYPELKELYNILSDSITSFYAEKVPSGD